MKIRKILLIIATLILPSLASAQTTTVTGTIIDANSNAYASGTASAIKSVTTGQSPGTPVNVSTNSSGFFTMSLPSPASYIFTICAPPIVIGPLANPTPIQQCFTTTQPISVSGGSLDITTTLNALAPILGPKQGSGTAGCIPGTPVNSLQKNGGGNCAASAISDDGTTVSVNEDTSSIGPNPYVDIRNYNSRSVNAAVAPQAPGITASITATQFTVAISASSTFKNNDGISIFGAGAVQSMTTPVAPTVIPAVASLGTGIGSLATGATTVVGGPAGGTTYNYQIIARDKQGGYTAASPVGTTSTGQTLGFQTITISAITKSGMQNTVTTAAPHGLATNAMVQIFGTSDDMDFGGWFRVASSADNTHFTYFNGQDSANGAQTSATGGTVNYWNCNHLSWTQVTGAFAYYIYGRTGGSLTLLGVSKPSGTVVDLTWDDYGSPMMDGFLAPYYIPTTPPVSPANDLLTTTIASGGGTTSLTIANAAVTSVSGATIVFDNAPTLLAAVNAARSTTGGMVYIPAGGFVINSYLTLPGQISISQAGSLTLNDTIQVVGGTRWFGDLTPQGASAPQFAYSGEISVLTARATPGVYGTSPGPANCVFRGLGFPQSSNGAISIILDQANHDTFEWLNFPTGGGTGDYMGIGLMLRGSVNVFNNTMRNISILSAQGKSTVTPVIYCENCGFMQIFNISASGRSFLFQSAVDLHIQGGREQAGNAPFVTVQAGSVIGIKDIELDTMVNPLVVNLSTSIGPTPGGINLTVDNAGSPSFNGTGILPNVSGSPFVSVVGSAGQNTGSVSIGGGRVQTSGVGGGVRAQGTSSIGYLMSLPAAPGVAIGAHNSCVSNCVPAGTYFYTISALDVYGSETGRTLTTSGTTDGTQTITVSWTPVFGQVSTRRFRGPNVNPSSTNSDTAPGIGIGGTSYLDTSNIFYSNTNFNLGGTSSSLGSAGAFVSALGFVGGGFANTFSNNFTASRTSGVTDANDVLPSVQQCGTTSTCAKTAQTAAIFVYGGPIALSGGTITITALPFTSATSYVCFSGDSTAINALDIVYNSGSSVTFNGTTTDSIRYGCYGN